MTLKTNSRIAGFTFLFYIAIGITGLMLSKQILTGAESTSAKVIAITAHIPTMQLSILLTWLQALCALVLAVSIYALTRDLDRDIARMAMLCRVGEAVVGILAPLGTMALLWAARVSAETNSAVTATNSIAELIFASEEWTVLTAATCFALGSTLYCYLFLRARRIPVVLAWLGFFASVLLVVVLPLRFAGYIANGMFAQMVWMPMLVFEVWFAIWLLVKGVKPANENSIQ